MKQLVLFFASLMALTASLQAKPLVPNREGAAFCHFQLIYSDPDLIDGRPQGGDGKVILRPDGPLRWKGDISYDINPLREGAPAYRLEAILQVEKDRSTWVQETPRLTVITRLHKGEEIVAMNEANSDQLLTPAMLNWMRKVETARVVSKMLNPQLINRLEKIDEAEVKSALPDYFRAMKISTQRGWLPRHEISRVDTVCTINL